MGVSIYGSYFISFTVILAPYIQLSGPSINSFISLLILSYRISQSTNMVENVIIMAT